MKKKYETPKAELVIFDYRESVTACSDFGWWWGFCVWKWWEQNTQPQQNQGAENPNNRNNNPYYAPGWGLHCS